MEALATIHRGHSWIAILDFPILRELNNTLGQSHLGCRNIWNGIPCTAHKGCPKSQLTWAFCRENILRLRLNAPTGRRAAPLATRTSASCSIHASEAERSDGTTTCPLLCSLNLHDRQSPYVEPKLGARGWVGIGHGGYKFIDHLFGSVDPGRFARLHHPSSPLLALNERTQQ